MTEQNFYKGILVFCLLLLLILAVAPGCTPIKSVEVRDSVSNLKYEKLLIDGMPCILWSEHSLATDESRGGLTCDWSQWDGNADSWLRG